MNKELGEMQNKIYQATVIAEKNTKRNNLGQVVIPLDDEWRDEDCWDELYGKINKAICPMCFEEEIGENTNGLCLSCYKVNKEEEELSEQSEDIWDMPSPTLYGEEAKKLWGEIRTPPSEIAKKNGEKLMKYFEDNFPKVSTMCIPMPSIPVIKGADAEEILNNKNIITREKLDKWAEEYNYIEIKKGD